MAENIIQGNPTKTFFIGMITRDISIKDAILDLLDNSIDGANRINPQDFTGLWIDLNISKEKFTVKDNCGGFSLDMAQKYAFRFGRPDDAPPTGGSIGRFGVGMKRSLFKMGQWFEVESKNDGDHFKVEVDVNEWKKQKSVVRKENDSEVEIDDWNFKYSLINHGPSNLNEFGTYIKVTKLNEDVADVFDDITFLSDLEDDIERILNFSIEKGLKIRLNGKELQKKGIVLFNDSSSPYFHEIQFNNVKIRIVAGLSYVGTPSKSGWYIYCNDRLVLEADKTTITGWKSSGIPQWHVDYVMFKGIVFMDSKETINLPLTTTKKGVDATSVVYKRALFFMREAMSLILSFLKRVSKLGSEANEYRKLLGEQEDKIYVHELKATDFEESRSFKAPPLDQDIVSIKNEMARISFSVNRDKGIIAKNHSEAKSWKELGEIIFDYYFNMEELDDE